MEKKELYKLLNLKKTEIKIYESLVDFVSIAEISAKNKLARMTVHITIKRFLKRGLVISDRIGKRKVYKQNIQNSLLGKTSLPLNDYENIVIHRGTKELFETWNKMTKLKSERYVGYQPNSSITHSLKKINIEDIMKLNDGIRENDHIVEAFIEKGYLQTAEKLIPKSQYGKWLKSLRRKYIVYEVDKNIFQNKNEVFIVRDSIFITDWQKEICVEIKQLETVYLMKNFFELLKLASTRVDFSAKLI